MSSRWAESFQPTVEQLENYHDREMNGETLTAEEQFISDLKSTAGSATVEDVKPDIETGRRIGEARAKAAETYNQVMDAYRK